MHFPVNCMKIMCFPLFYGTHCDSTGTVATIFQETPLEITDWNLCLCVQEVHSTVNDVGGMVAQWLVLLPPKSLHVSPKFHRRAHQVEWRLWMCMTKSISIHLPCMSQAYDALRILSRCLFFLIYFRTACRLKFKSVILDYFKSKCFQIRCKCYM